MTVIATSSLIYCRINCAAKKIAPLFRALNVEDGPTIFVSFFELLIKLVILNYRIFYDPFQLKNTKSGKRWQCKLTMYNKPFGSENLSLNSVKRESKPFSLNM